MKKDKKEALAKGLDVVELEDGDISDHKETMLSMRQHDLDLDEESIEEEYKNRRIQHE